MIGDRIFRSFDKEGHGYDVFIIRDQQIIVPPNIKTDQHAREFIAVINRTAPGVCRDHNTDQILSAIDAKGLKEDRVTREDLKAMIADLHREISTEAVIHSVLLAVLFLFAFFVQGRRRQI